MEEGRANQHNTLSAASRVCDPAIIGVSIHLLKTYLKNKGSTSSKGSGADSLRARSLSARENDFVYQKGRIIHFKRNLRAYPMSRSRITNVPACHQSLLLPHDRMRGVIFRLSCEAKYGPPS